MKAWSSPSDAKWPRTAASTSRAAVPGFRAGLARAQSADARLEQLALAGGRPAADGERVGEVAPVARDDHREVEQEQVARLDLPRGRRAALVDVRTAGPDAKSP